MHGQHSCIPLRGRELERESMMLSFNPSHLARMTCALQGSTIAAALDVLTKASYRLLPTSLYQLATTSVDGLTLLQRLQKLLPLQRWRPDITIAWCNLVRNIFDSAGQQLYQAAQAAGLDPQDHTGLQPLLTWLSSHPKRVRGAGPGMEGLEINRNWGTRDAACLKRLRETVHEAINDLQLHRRGTVQGPAAGGEVAVQGAQLLPAQGNTGKGAEGGPSGLQGCPAQPQQQQHIQAGPQQQ
jgi:hypothetical protein